MNISIKQHLLHEEQEFTEELSKAGFPPPEKYTFDTIEDEEGESDGSILIFDIQKKDEEKLIAAAKKLPVDYVEVWELDEEGDEDRDIYIS